MQYPPEMQRAFLLKYQPQIQAHAQAQGQAQAQAQGPARASPGTPAGSVYTGQSPAASGQTGDSPSLGMEYQQAPHYTQQQVGYARQQGHMEAAGRHRDVSSRQHYSGGGMAYPQSSWDAGVGSPRPPPPQQVASPCLGSILPFPPPTCLMTAGLRCPCCLRPAAPRGLGTTCLPRATRMVTHALPVPLGTSARVGTRPAAQARAGCPADCVHGVPVNSLARSCGRESCPRRRTRRRPSRR